MTASHSLSPNTSPTDWVFPSENTNTPVWANNAWYDKIRPTLATLGLAWANYQVLRRSCSTLLNHLADGKTVADQLGHTLDENQNVYTQAAINRQRDAVNQLDQAIAA